MVGYRLPKTVGNLLSLGLNREVDRPCTSITFNAVSFGSQSRWQGKQTKPTDTYNNSIIIKLVIAAKLKW